MNGSAQNSYTFDVVRKAGFKKFQSQDLHAVSPFHNRNAPQFDCIAMLETRVEKLLAEEADDGRTMLQHAMEWLDDGDLDLSGAMPTAMLHVECYFRT